MESGRDCLYPCKGKSWSFKAPSIFRRHANTDFKLAEFVRTLRMTMMSFMGSAGDCSPTIFVFKGGKMPYKQVLCHGRVYVETLGSCLPRGALVCMCAYIGGVNSDSFYKCASTRELLDRKRRKLLLTYDGYRSHMSVLDCYLHRVTICARYKLHIDCRRTRSDAC